MSLFLTNDKQPFPVSLLTVERVLALRNDIDAGDRVTSLIEELKGREASEADVEYLFSRINEDASQPVNPGRKRVTKGSNYSAFVASLPPDRALLLACGGDWPAAHRLYCLEDKATALQFISDWFEHQVGCFEYVYEAVLYAAGGMGGGRYEEDKGPEAPAANGSAMSAEDVAKFFSRGMH